MKERHLDFFGDDNMLLTYRGDKQKIFTHDERSLRAMNDF